VLVSLACEAPIFGEWYDCYTDKKKKEKKRRTSRSERCVIVDGYVSGRETYTGGLRLRGAYPVGMAIGMPV
jgi:hypothetical protein